MPPVSSVVVRRHRGKELILLHRLVKVVQEIDDHNARYPQGPPPAPTVRRHLEFTDSDMILLQNLALKATAFLDSQWPPPVS